MYAGAPKRVVIPVPLVYVNWDRQLWSWSTLDETPTLDSVLMSSPFNDPHDRATHVYRSGCVCFGGEALDVIAQGVDPVDVFWSSQFNRMPAWCRTRDAVVHAPRPTERGFVAGRLSNEPMGLMHETTLRQALDYVCSRA